MQYPKRKDTITEAYNGKDTWVRVNKKTSDDSKKIRFASFVRKTNFYWFTMFQKLSDPGLIYEYIGAANEDGKNYDIVKISFESKNERIAYDICPVNIVLNHYVKQLGLNYDDEGKIARTGEVNEDLLEQLNDLDFYKETYPKSLGLEWVNSNVFPLIDAFKIEIKDVLRTFVEHVAIQIAANIGSDIKKFVLVTGGGVFNAFLIERLKLHTIGKIKIPSKDIIEFKEALIFGFLGVLKLRNEINCLQSVTGASKNHSSGKIYLH